jgi:uncharacterized protein (TIGR00299 family) protein
MLDLGLDEEEFLAELKKLSLDDYEVEIKKSLKGGITGTDVYIKTHEYHPHRGLKQIYEIIDGSELESKVKQKSKEAFYKLALVEGSIHGKSPEDIHFHEVGAIDSIVDIVGAFILMDMLKPCRVHASSVNVGSGTVKCAHGILPVPAPATMELLKGVPVYAGDEPGEFTTPTGALLLSMFVDQYGPMPSGIPEKSGYGLGKTDRKSPNVLRAVLLKEHCNIDDTYTNGLDRDKIAILEANVDDMNPEIYEEVMESLFQKGALDVFLTPIIMKKSRPGVKLTCLCPLDKKLILVEAILRETTTLGVRELEAGRVKLYRETEEINTPLGNIRLKISKMDNEIVRITPEYEDMKRVARDNKIPLLKAYEIIKPLSEK